MKIMQYLPESLPVKLGKSLANLKNSKMLKPRGKKTVTRKPNKWLPVLMGLQLASLVCLVHWAQTCGAAHYGHYDPEQQDGIPVLSARSLNPQPSDDWLNGDMDNEGQRPDHHRAGAGGGGAHRRNSDADLDDGVEDDDDDEYQSGSNKHEMIEPSFGESKRAAQDGDEIESFFDKHLGPPQEAGSSEDASSEAPVHAVPALAGTSAAVDSATGGDDEADEHDDMYTAAASSPLSTIFQSLLGAHRKPFVIHATEQVEDNPTSSSSTSASAKTKTDKDTTIGTSDSSLRGSAASPAAHHYMQQVAPVAFVTPVASPSTIESYESQADEPGNQQQPVREIYIGRRPAVTKYLQQSAASTQRGQQVWRNSPMMYSQSARPMLYDQQAADYARYPVAASYAYQREQQLQHQQPTDDAQTVTYGLSFGASSEDEASDDSSGAGVHGATEPASHQEDSASSSYDEAAQQQPPAGAYMPYNERELMRYKTASTRAHNNYHNNGAMMTTPAGYIRVPQHRAYMYQQQQSPYHGARYHRDPSEAQLVGVVRGNPYQQQAIAAAGQSFRGNNYNKADSMETREQLLANLNKEIRASPYYRQNVLARRPDRQMTTSQTINKGLLNTDLDTYDSYHSEMDPYKTFTSTSRMIRYPNYENNNNNNNIVPVESGSNRVPSNADANDTRQQQLDDNPDDKQSGGQLLQSSSIVNRTNSQFDSSRDLQPDHKKNNNNEVNIGQQSVLIGPITNHDFYKTPTSQDAGELMGNNNQNNQQSQSGRVNLSRVRREDSDDRESDADDDDDGVWVDDDEDDNKQQSSDVNETSQVPEEEEDNNQGQQQYDDQYNQQYSQINPPGVIGAPHGYELSPNDLMIYQG